MNQNEFVQKRAQAHAAACVGIANDPLVQAALALRAADLEVKAAIAQRAASNGRKDDKPVQAVVAVVASQARLIVIRRQAG